MAVKLYEGMFIIDSAKGGSEFPGAIRLIASMLTRHGASRIAKADTLHCPREENVQAADFRRGYC